MNFFEKSYENIHQIFKAQTEFPEFNSRKGCLFFFFEVRVNSEDGKKGFCLNMVSYPSLIFSGENLSDNYTFLGTMKAPPKFPWFVKNKTLEKYPDIIDFDKTIDEIFNKVVKQND